MAPSSTPTPKPTFRPERAAAKRYNGLIAGVDEAGRGPWAGPVVAAAVIFMTKPPKGIDDSKKLRPEQRETLYRQIREVAHVGVGICCVTVIDTINIYHATHKAMVQALDALPETPAVALIDGNRCPKADIPMEPIIGGDAISLSIAAASIIAKVTRDRIMRDLAAEYPNYAFDRNKGYGTREHIAALNAHGVTLQHRHSFRPVQERVRFSI